MSDVAPGWYPDPTNPSQERLWDGSDWVDKVRPKPPATKVPSRHVGVAHPSTESSTEVLYIFPRDGSSTQRLALENALRAKGVQFYWEDMELVVDKSAEPDTDVLWKVHVTERVIVRPSVRLWGRVLHAGSHRKYYLLVLVAFVAVAAVVRLGKSFYPESGIATSVSAGLDHACTVTSDGGIRCWGANDSGQLGDGSTNNSSMPVRVAGVTDAISVTAGSSNTCAIMQDMSLWCWGYNGNGALGDGTFSDQHKPVKVPGINNLRMVSMGANTCALLIDNSVWCWGGSYGSKYRATPLELPWLPAVNAIRGGVFALQTCAIVTVSGEVVCWGNNLTDASKIRKFPGEGYAAGLSMTGGVVCVTVRRWQPSASDEASCWVPFSEDEVWELPPTSSYALDNFTVHVGQHPLLKVAIPNFAAELNTYCSIVEGGVVECAGSNIDGALGDGSNTRSRSSMSAVAGVSDATEISMGFNFTCVLLRDGGVVCWGENESGNLGNGSTVSSSIPVAVVGLGRERSASTR